MSFATLERLLYPNGGFHWGTHPVHPEDDDETPSAIHRRRICRLVSEGRRLENAPEQHAIRWAELGRLATLLAKNHDTALTDPVLNQEWGHILESARDLVAPQAAA